MFDYKKPTVQMLGRWQPWHGGHTALFEKAWDITNQVVIMVRDVQGVDAGMGNDDNPFDFQKIEENIVAELFMHGYMVDDDFIIMQVSNDGNVISNYESQDGKKYDNTIKLEYGEINNTSNIYYIEASV